MSNQQFKNVRKGKEKTMLKQIIDDDDEYDDQKTKHENLVYEYLTNTELEETLILGLKAAISGDVVPKNPWCEMSRALGTQNMKRNIFDTFELLAKEFKKASTVDIKAFNIHEISEKKMQQDQTDGLDKGFCIYGYPQNLEYLFLPNIKNFKESVNTILPSVNREFSNGRLNVCNSLSGGYILKSSLIIYPNSHPKDLEINCECFVETSDLQSAYDIFSQFVYFDCLQIKNKKDGHIIKEFIFYKYDPILQENVKKSWKLSRIKPKYMEQFKQDVITNVQESNMIYWKGYCRVPAFENLDLVETQADTRKDQNNQPINPDLLTEEEKTPYQYIEVYKYYNLHININGQQESRCNQPLGSLIKGVFFEKYNAIRYASYFYKQGQDPLTTQAFLTFTNNQLKLVQKKWSEQNIGACAWELLYLVLYSQQADVKRELLDSIIQIVSSDYSGLVTCTKFNNIIRMLIEKYFTDQNPFLLPIINSIYKVYREKMIELFGKSSGSDIIRYREFIFRLFREMEDAKGGFIIQEISLFVLNTLHRVTKFMGIGNLQKVGSVTYNVSLYIYDALKKNKLGKDDYITYEEFQSLKAPKKMMHVSQEVVEYKKGKNTEFKSEADIEDYKILQFLNEYDIFDNLYEILRDIFFGKQVPNALPTAQFKVETKAIKYQLFEISREEVDNVLCNVLTEQNRKDIKDPTKEFYEFQSEDMQALDVGPIYGLRQCIYYASVFEIAALYDFLKEYDWKKALTRNLPTNYQVKPILSISTINLFHNSSILERTYGEWNISWDWIIRGESYPHAQQIFIDTILKYMTWLEMKTEGIVIGLFQKKSPRDPFLTIDEIMEAEDLTEIKQIFLGNFTSVSDIYFKVIFKSETRFKMINFYINLHFVDQVKLKAENLLTREQPETYIKIFFNDKDFLFWNKLYPYSDGTALRLIGMQQNTLFYTGSLNEAMKLELIKFYISSQIQDFLSMSRILFSYSEIFSNYQGEAQTFYFLFKYLERKKNIKRPPKLKSVKDISLYFQEFSDSLEVNLCAYDNIYFDSIGASIINYIKAIKEVFTQEENEETEYGSYANKMAKISDMCQVVSDSVILTYRQLLLEDYQYTVLWLPKQR